MASPNSFAIELLSRAHESGPGSEPDESDSSGSDEEAAEGPGSIEQRTSSNDLD